MGGSVGETVKCPDCALKVRIQQIALVGKEG